MKSFFKLSILFLFLSISVLAQNDAKQVLESLQTKYKSLKDFTAEFKHSVNNKVNLSGTFIYSKDNKLRVELKNSTIISDGKSIWNYNKSKNQVVINNSDSNNNNFFTIDKFLYDYPSKCSLSLEPGNGKQVLVLTAIENSGLDFKKGRIWLNQDNLITKATIENLTGTQSEIELSNYILNKNIPDSKFSFSPPEGTKVIDLRK